MAQDDIERRIREGRGSGQGTTYVPWIKITDFSSRGLVHRVPGLRSRRMHHLLSNLEVANFIINEWPDRTLDLREQWPLLPVEETVEIAAQLGVKHPADPISRRLAVMTTDLVLTVDAGFSTLLRPINCKYIADLTGRALEKIEIERRYWKIRSCELSVVTEREIPHALLKNLLWIRGCWDLGDAAPGAGQSASIAELLFECILRNPTVPLNRISIEADQTVGLPVGSCLNIARHALARKWWRRSLQDRIKPSSPLRGLTDDPRAPWRNSSEPSKQ
jgi:hypothetical protein